MVEKLFYADPYMKEAEAKVTKIEGASVWLDRTLFFAFSGGQESDSGKISGIPLAAVEKDGEDIRHVLEREPGFSVGDKVKLELDWEKRYAIMKLHAAAHLVFGFLGPKMKDTKIIGSNVSPRKARIDFEYPESIKPFLKETEDVVNYHISKDLAISVYDDPDEKGKRWWKFVFGEHLTDMKVMKMPCCGLHVKNTKEIGGVKLKRVGLGKGKERVEITLAPPAEAARSPAPAPAGGQEPKGIG
ncbi:MAG: alanyl-tRNA editing protein [Candidatus Aenigmatarchaeota archaeon]